MPVYRINDDLAGCLALMIGGMMACHSSYPQGTIKLTSSDVKIGRLERATSESLGLDSAPLLQNWREHNDSERRFSVGTETLMKILVGVLIGFAVFATASIAVRLTLASSLLRELHRA